MAIYECYCLYDGYYYLIAYKNYYCVWVSPWPPAPDADPADGSGECGLDGSVQKPR